MRRHGLLLLALLPVSLAALPDCPSAAQSTIRWKKTVVDTRFRSEGIAVADVDRDGRPDLLVGDLWYRAPDWSPREIRKPGEYNGETGYSNAFLVFADDVDGDRWTDQLVIGFPGQKALWYRNPARNSGHWREFPITESAGNETPHFADLDGDGRPELVTPFKESQMAFYNSGSDPEKGFAQFLCGEPGRPGVRNFSHGLGVGDVDGDRRPDILTTEGYYRAPKNPRSGIWPFVPAKLGEACAHMYTHDFDGDGDQDVISSSAHAIGVWWYEQRPGPEGPEFVRHVIDDSFSQSHSMVMADLNGDGRPDFVTGKRFWAHGPKGDVNPGDPCVLYWFEFRRQGGKVVWTRHLIDDDSGVGTQFTVADLNGDRRPDVAVSNKKGVHVFQQKP